MRQDRSKVPVDYDSNPERRNRTVRTSQRFLNTGDVYEDVARHFSSRGVTRVLDVGCGEGFLQPIIESAGIEYLGIDSSKEQLKDAPPNRIFGDASNLPFADGSFDGVAALYMLYHFDEPEVVVRESERVLASGGVFISCAPSYMDMPELEQVFRLDGPHRRITFDAESGIEIVSEIFGNVEVDSWDGQYITLPDEEALIEYCRAMEASDEAARQAPGLVNTPLDVTKRGALHIAVKR